jgi:putative addiction module component (TIGR02574 family)
MRNDAVAQGPRASPFQAFSADSPIESAKGGRLARSSNAATLAVQREPQLSTIRSVANRGARGQTDHMQPIDLKLSELTVAERIQLAEDLWDSVAADTGGLPLTDAQKTELELRLADFERDPGAGEAWEVVRERIQRRLAQTG